MKKIIVFIIFFGCFREFYSYSQVPLKKNWVKNADSIYKENTKFNGNISLCATGNNSEFNNLYKFKNEVTIDCGTYPYQMDFKLKSETLFEDQKFKERLNEIDFSFDYHPLAVGNGRFLETYIFGNQFSNEYLNIDAKYEIGGGIVFNLWSSKRLNKDGITIQSKISDTLVFRPKSKYNDVIKCMGNNGFGEEETLLIYKANQFNIKKNSIWRFSLLAGVFYELEHLCPPDSLKDFTTDFWGTSSLIKFSIRPKFEYRPNEQFKIGTSIFFKFPFEKFHDSYIKDNLKRTSRLNLFIDCSTVCSFKLTESIEFSFEYRLLYDFIPKQKIISWKGENKLISASSYNNYIDGKLSFKF